MSVFILSKQINRSSTISSLIRSLGSSRGKSDVISLPDLPYDYAALEPVISAEIMQLHHGKHHATYTSNFNTAKAKYMEVEHQLVNGGSNLKNEERVKLMEKLIALQANIKFNGGGHINHSLFWKMLCPPQQFKEPSKGSPLLSMIDRDFGSINQLMNNFNAKAAMVQGSGWGWLAFDPESKKLTLATTANQDPLASTTHLFPLLGIDVWEHAYYLQYKNARPEYLKNIWRIINWTFVESRLKDATDGKF